MAKIIIIGASGTIGSAVADRLEKSHTVIRVAHRQGDHTVDLGSKASIETLLEKAGPATMSSARPACPVLPQ